jgi:regulator of protease activity HflC (stomatin/prohibitin superfamily)
MVVSFVVDEVVGGFFISVPPGHIACVYDRIRGVLDKVLKPGLHLKIPFLQVAKLFNAQVVEYTIHQGFDLNQAENLGDQPLNAVTADNVMLTVEGTILFRIEKDRAPELWENVGEGFVSKVVRPVSRSRIRTVMAESTIDQIKNQRTKIESRIRDELNQIFNQKALNCEGVLLSDIKIQNSAEQNLLISQR